MAIRLHTLGLDVIHGYMTIIGDRLHSGGLMTNYSCSSQCRHCAYFCGPRWENRYIDETTLRKNLRAMGKAGCPSIHIGGGEPFLNREKLIDAVRWCRAEGFHVEYVETNASWCNDDQSARKVLAELRKAGLDTLLISISPFHNEYIPFSKTRGLIAACRSAGMGVFPWVEGFISDIAAFDERSTHSLDEYEELHGAGYIANLPNRYWISLRGRAIATFKPYVSLQTAEEICRTTAEPCNELYDTSHFHVDLDGSFIPGICSGISIAVEDLGVPIDGVKYPYLTSLLTGGLAELYRKATRECDFVSGEGYSGKCDLCYDVRRHLVIACGITSRDLQPEELYSQYS